MSLTKEAAAWLVERWRWWTASKKEKADYWCARGVHEPQFLAPYPEPVYVRTWLPGEQWGEGCAGTWRDIGYHFWKCRNCGVKGKQEMEYGE